MYSNKFFSSAFLSVVFGALLGCATLKREMVELGETTGNETLIKAAADLTSEQEYYLGRSIMARVLTKNPAVESKILQSYINRVGQYLALHSSRPVLFNGYRFVVVKEESPLAMSAPGGFVTISSGMLELIENEDELASVLAHEIAHIALKHSEKNIKNSNRIKLSKDIISTTASPFLNSLNSMGASSEATTASFNYFTESVAVGVDAKFNKDQETDADKHALGILRKSGYSTTSLHKLVSRMPANTELISRHPRTASRLGRLLEQTKNDQPLQNDEAKNRFLKVLRKSEYTE